MNADEKIELHIPSVLGFEKVAMECAASVAKKMGFTEDRNPIRNRVQKFIDRVFYRLEYDYQETVQRISDSLRSLLSLDQIGKRMMDTASNTNLTSNIE
jgi:hypothetical protein